MSAPSSKPVAVEPCEHEQVEVTPGSFGAAAGTNYLKVFVELRQGPACSIPWGPLVTILAPDGSEVARASETSDQLVELHYITRYYIAWSESGDCPSMPAGTFTARIELSAGVTIEIPVGDFRPTCVDGDTRQSLAMYADE